MASQITPISDAELLAAWQAGDAAGRGYAPDFDVIERAEKRTYRNGFTVARDCIGTLLVICDVYGPWAVDIDEEARNA